MSQKFNHLIIGIGGTGCAVVREIKKKLYMKWRTEGNSGAYPDIYEFKQPRGDTGEDLCRVGTLSIDSNKQDLEGEGQRDAKWGVFGTTLDLKDNEKVLINPAGIAEQLNNLDRFPGMEPWIRGEMDFVREITRGATGPVGCNQIRRMGRLALANGNNFQRVIARVMDRLNEIESGSVGADIHIACTLAAGTGSGAIVDTIAQLQKALRLRGRDIYKVFVHGFATAKEVGDVNAGNFYANQFAALTELNAFRLINYKPWDISAVQGTDPHRLVATLDPARDDQEHVDLAGTFKSVSLLTETTAGGVPMNLSQQTEVAAEFLYQIAVGQLGDVPKELRDAFTLEDRTQYPADEQGGDRATCFISYGVQKVAIPDKEIREKLAYTFARQFILKAVYDNWDDGYRPQDKAYAKHAIMENKRASWRVSKSHLHLDVVETVTGEPEFPPYLIEWTEAINAIAGEVQSDGTPQERWLDELDARVADYEINRFRERGLDSYFANRREPAEIGTRARLLRQHSERDLLDNFEALNKEFPLHHLADCIGYLRSAMDEDCKEFSDELLRIRDEASGYLSRILADMGDIRNRYARAGIMAGMRRKPLYANYVEATIQLKYWQTMDKANTYGLEFAPKLNAELLSLERTLQEFDTRMKRLAKDLETEITARIKEDEDGGNVTVSTLGVEYMVDATEINRVIREKFLRDKTIQDTQSHATMAKLRFLRGERREFQAYLDKMPVHDTLGVGGAFSAAIRSVAEDVANEAHLKLTQNDNNFPGIFGLNIMKKLWSDSGGQVRSLEPWLKGLLDKAMPLVTFDPTEAPMNLDPAGGATGPLLRRCVFVPQCAQLDATDPAFHNEFVRAVKAQGGDVPGIATVNTIAQVVPESRNASEIVILSVAFFFSARRTTVVKDLADRFRQRMSDKDETKKRRAIFEVFTETHEPTLPSLLQPSGSEVREAARPYALLGTALGLMHIPPQTANPVYFGLQDSDGRKTEGVVTHMICDSATRDAHAKAVADTQREIPLELFCLLKKYDVEFKESSARPLTSYIAERIRLSRPDKAELASILRGLTGIIFVLGGKSEQDPSYQKYLKAEDAAQKILARLT